MLPELLTNSFLLIVGFFFMIWGASLLVDGAVSLAVRAGISNLVIGMTLVAFGTSAPELAASMNASISGFGDISCGNIIGSNIANLGLVMGISALLMPIDIKRSTILWEVPFVITLSVIFWLMEINLEFSRIDGVILVILFLVFVVYCVLTAKTDVDLDLVEAEDIQKHRLTVKKALLYSGAGIIFLAGGSDFLVKGATGFAVAVGISEAAVAVSIVALGTSLPELVTSAVAAAKKKGDISIGNILGSNIFNFLIVGGLTALVKPFHISERILNFDTPIMLFFTLLLFLVVTTGRKVSRIEGLMYTILYIAYIVLVYRYPNGIPLF